MVASAGLQKTWKHLWGKCVRQDPSNLLRGPSSRCNIVTGIEELREHLERTVDALRSPSGGLGTPRPRITRPESKPSDSALSHAGETTLPEGLIPWRRFARAHGLTETRIKKIDKKIHDGAFTITRGSWIFNGQEVTQALDPEQQDAFLERFGHA